jgi:lycopene beta-cyclase
LSENVYDYFIIGGGLSGIQLALAFAEDAAFKDKKIGIIEPSSKDQNDKTWCFWEKGKGKWKEVTYKSWNKTLFVGSDQSREFELSPYSYKMIRSIDFYKTYIARLRSKSNVEWIEDEITSISQENLCRGKAATYSAKQIFDSRLKPDFKKSKQPKVLQHFKGYIIKTESPQFDDAAFTMMDYSLKYQDQCCFTYVLPFSKNEALVEFTFFSPNTLKEEEYDKMIKQYLELRSIVNYTVEETESGVIPMSTYPFWKKNREGYLKIGTAGGWVKASSGYSFMNTENKVTTIIENIKAKQPLDRGLFSKRFQWYDRIFLSILENENHLGNQIFQEMYTRNSIQQIFQFLDEESSLAEELKIISRFSSRPFIRALFRELF